MKIIEKSFKWNGELIKRKATDYIVLHHRAGEGDVESIHRTHIARGWAGIGYHFYVRKNGEVFRGRPINTAGAHCVDCNKMSVAICFEGNFEKENTMPAVQIKAGQELVSCLKQIYPLATVKRHRDFGGTACPGKYFPFEEIKRGAVSVKDKLTTANDIVWELMNGSLKVEVSDVDGAVKALEKAKIENSSLYWILYKLVNR